LETAGLAVRPFPSSAWITVSQYRKRLGDEFGGSLWIVSEAFSIWWQEGRRRRRGRGDFRWSYGYWI